MPSGKNRLYVGLYARGGQPKMSTLEDTYVLSDATIDIEADYLGYSYHWALIIGPKDETSEGRGWRFHAKEGLRSDRMMGWMFEEKEIPLVATQMLLVRICVGKIEKDDRVKAILRSVPIRDNDESWNCVYWVREALQLLKADDKAMGTSELDWTNVRNIAMAYIQQKRNEHRFDGLGSFDMSKAATFDLLERRETAP